MPEMLGVTKDLRDKRKGEKKDPKLFIYCLRAGERDPL